MDMMERLVHLFRKFHQLKISNEEYVCMKAINFLNQGNISNKFGLYFQFSSPKWGVFYFAVSELEGVKEKYNLI